MFSEVDEVAERLGKFLHLLKTTVILILHFVQPYAITFTECLSISYNSLWYRSSNFIPRQKSKSVTSIRTKLPIVSFYHSLAFAFRNVFPCRITFDTFYKISLIKVFLRARKEIIEFEKVSDVNEV